MRPERTHETQETQKTHETQKSHETHETQETQKTYETQHYKLIIYQNNFWQQFWYDAMLYIFVIFTNPTIRKTSTQLVHDFVRIVE